MGSKGRSGARGQVGLAPGRPQGRPLAGIERTLFTFSRLSPINLVVLVGLEGPALDDLLPGALAALQQRHPLLRARIAGPRSRPRFEISAPGDVPPIPVGVPREADPVLADPVLAVVEDEMNTPFDTARCPLARATLMRAGTRTDLVLTVHHAIADGASTANLVHELLDWCRARVAGEPAPPLEPTAVPPALTDLLPAHLRGARRQLHSLRYVAREGRDEVSYRLGSRGRRRPIPRSGQAATRPLHVDRDQTRLLVDRARRSRLTLTSLLSAALLWQASTVLYGGRPCTMRAMVWVDLRPHLEPRVPDEMLGCYLSMLRFVLRVDPRDGFGALASQVRDGIERASRRGDLVTAVLVTGGLARAAARWPVGRLATTALSYATAPVLQDSYGPLEMRELRAFVSNTPTGAELAGASGLAQGELWCDLLYWDQEISAPESVAVGEGMLSVLREFAAARADDTA